MTGLQELAGQVLAFTIAELRRQLTTPVWAVLLVLWTVVCTLLMQVILSHAANTELPVGETAMSAFFRSGNIHLALMLIVFVPLLSMDAIAGRRDSGRLEHLLIAGLRPGALIIGSYCASCLALLILLLPPIFMHVVLAWHGMSDGGHAIGGMLALLLCAGAIAAVGICVSAWSHSRTTTGLITAAIGLIWWMGDHLADSPLSAWGLSLATTIRHFAGGLIDGHTVLSFTILILCLLGLARFGLVKHLNRGPHATASLSMGIFMVGLLLHAPSCTSTTSLSTSGVQISEATQQAAAKLHAIQARLIATKAMEQDQADGPLYEAVRSALDQLGGSGLKWQAVDRDLEPEVIVDLQARQAIAAEDLQHPLLVVSSADRDVVLHARQLASIDTDTDGRRMLRAEHIDRRLLDCFRLLAGDLPKVAWMETTGCRKLEPEVPADRPRLVGAWARSLAADGYQVVPLKSWPKLQEQEWDLVIIPGLRQDPPETVLNYLGTYVRQGGSVLLSMDGASQSQQPELRRFLQERGIIVSQGRLSNRPQSKQAIVDMPVLERDGPGRLVGLASGQIRVPDALPMRSGEQSDSSWNTETFLPLPQPLWLISAHQQASMLQQARHLIMSSSKADAGTLLVCASTDMFSDAAISAADNRLLARSLSHWLCRTEEASDAQQPELSVSSRVQLADGGSGLRFILGIGMPIVAIALGTGTWWWRRREW